MDRYETDSQDMSRIKRNQQLYNVTDMSELSRIKTNNNVSVISDAPKEINIEKIRNYVYSIIKDEDEEEKSRVSLELPKEQEEEKVEVEEKDYDINSVLERAREKKEVNYEEDRHRKLNNTQIDILKNIKIHDEEEQEKQKDDDLTDAIDELNTEEKTIVDLIQNIQSHGKKKELFEDLMADNDNTVVMAPIDDERNKENLKEALLDITQDLESIKQPESDFTKEIKSETQVLKEIKEKELEKDLESDKTDKAPRITEIDKTFYTNSMTFNKKDFEGYDESLDDGKRSVFTTIAIIFIVIMLLATIVLILNFVFDWNLI